MKKLLLSSAFFATIFSASYAQITFPPFVTETLTGGVVIPVFQGMAGSMSVEGVAIAKVTGSFSSAAINATLTASTLETYANDFTILVTNSPDLATATVLLQVGGFSTFSATKVDWTCIGNCDTDVIGTVIDGTASFAGLDFTSSTNVIWITNGWANGQAPDPSTNTGVWDVTSLTFGGTLALGNLSIEGSTQVSAVAYPNPASDVLNIAVEGEEVVTVSVISMDGKTVSTTEGAAALVADLTAGMYIYEARTASGAIIRNTFIKK